MLQKSIERVLALPDLRPSPAVNAAFTELVTSVVATSGHMEQSESVCEQVRHTAAAAETELELAWARRIQEADTPLEVAALFPYADNYTELVRREIECVEASGKLLDGGRILIIGSGPLPLSAYEYVRQRSVIADHVDISARAVVLCHDVSRLLGVPGETLLGDGRTVTLSSRYDAILVAGLAGETLSDKQAIIDHIVPVLVEDGRIIVRSAKGSRALLYPAIEAAGLRNVSLLSEYHPDDDVINSVFIYKKETV